MPTATRERNAQVKVPPPAPRAVQRCLAEQPKETTPKAARRGDAQRAPSHWDAGHGPAGRLGGRTPTPRPARGLVTAGGMLGDAVLQSGQPSQSINTLSANARGA